jgi:hypothetical protein
MKNIILQILRETVSENEQIESCRTNKSTNEFIRGFNMWRTGMCNQDTLNKNNYQYKIEMCVTPYVGERVKPENVCDVVLVEYNKSEIRNAFNRYMKLPIGCNIFNPESCEDYKDMKPKEVSKLPTNNTTTLSKTTTRIQLPEIPQDKNRLQQIIDKVVNKIKSRLGN